MGPVWASWNVLRWEGRVVTGEELVGATGELLEKKSEEASAGGARQDSDCLR